jgi:hypothetical protein
LVAVWARCAITSTSSSPSFSTSTSSAAAAVMAASAHETANAIRFMIESPYGFAPVRCRYFGNTRSKLSS